MHSLSYRVGHHIGVFVVQARKALRTMDVQPADEGEQPEKPFSLKELTDVPAIARKGVSLSDWYDRNVTCPSPWKLDRKRGGAGNPPERKRSSLDPLL